MIIFQIAPSFLERLAPEILASHPGIAPGKMIVVEAVVLVNCHPVAATVAGRNFTVHVETERK